MLKSSNRSTPANAWPPPARPAHTPRARSDRRLFERRDAGDPHARDELIERFLPLARSLARRYERSGEPLDDLVQVASLALVKAIDGYARERGVAFSSYAVPTIAGELKRYFRDRTWAVRPPRDLQDLTLRVDRAADVLAAQHGRPPTAAELSAAINATDEDVLEALQARSAHRGLSLYAPVRGSELALHDTLGVSDDGYARAETRAVLQGLLTELPRRSREVLRLRFEEDLTQAEIGALVGVSQMQISRIIRDAIGQLRLSAERQEHFSEIALRSDILYVGVTDPAANESR
jgi:RNA polymerase sigma-B factor